MVRPELPVDVASPAPLPPARGSIAGKITFGYYLIGSVILAVATMTFLELHALENRVMAGAHIGRFLNVTLEARRFEKNYLLYGQRDDLTEGLAYLNEARDLLTRHGNDFQPVAAADRLEALADEVDDYRRLLADSSPAMKSAEEIRLRAAGKRVVTAAEEMASAERRLLQSALSASRVRLLGSVMALIAVGVALARVLSRRVVRPLQQLEESMQLVSAGSLHQIRIDSRDREIQSLTAAFNRMLQELESQQGHLVRSQKLASLGTLLSGVAHELNNPLSNVSTSCQILLEELDQADRPMQRDMLKHIDEQTERARRIVQTLLEFARERGFRREPVGLAPLVEDTLRFVRGQFPSGVTVRVEIDEGLTLSADKQRLQQVFINLLKNAQQSMAAAGEITVRAHLGASPSRYPIKCHCPEQAVEIAICDTGSGIPPELLPRIFDPFFTTKPVGQGAGLGLSIVHEIIEEHDGCITVESTPGKGTTFYIRLPAAEAAIT